MEKRIEDTEKIPVNEAAEQKIARLEKKVAELESRNEKLTNDILYLRRQLYGRSSERFVPEAPSQLSIAFEGVESLPEEQEAQVEEITVTYTR
jgi:archaellum component FlaC